MQRFCVSLIAISFLLIVPGCKKIVVRNPSASAVKLQEAQAVDIPVPLRAKVQTHHFSHDENGGFFMGYSTYLNFDELIHYYSTEMERYGWQYRGLARGMQENLMVFEKPNRFATISLRASGSSSLIIISSGKREEGSSYI